MLSINNKTLFDFEESESKILQEIREVFNKYNLNIKEKQGYDYEADALHRGGTQDKDNYNELDDEDAGGSSKAVSITPNSPPIPLP